MSSPSYYPLEHDQVFLHCPAEEYKERMTRGYSWPYLFKILGSLKEKMQLQMRGVHIYVSSPSLHDQFGQIHIASRKFNVLFFLGDEKCERKFSFDQFDLVLRQYVDNKIFPSHKYFPLVGVDNEMPPVSILKPCERKLDAFFSGNINANRVGLYFSLTGNHFILNNFLANRIIAKILRYKMPVDVSDRLPGSYLAFTDGFARGLEKSQYVAKLCESRIAICPGGFVSNETIRHYEAACFGCIVLSAPLPGSDQNDAAPFIIMDSWKDIRRQVDCLLLNAQSVSDLQKRTLAWWRQYCSVEGYGEYVYRHLCSALAVSGKAL